MLEKAFLNAHVMINHVDFDPYAAISNIAIIHEKCNGYIALFQNYEYLLQKDKEIFIEFINVCRKYWVSANMFMVDLIYIGGAALLEIFKERKIDDELDVSRFKKFFVNHINCSKVEHELASLFAGASEMASRILTNNALFCFPPFNTDLFPQQLGG